MILMSTAHKIRKEPDVLALIGEIKNLKNMEEIEKRVMGFKENGGNIQLLITYLDYEIHDVIYKGLTEESIFLEKKLIAAKKICEELEKPKILK